MDKDLTQTFDRLVLGYVKTIETNSLTQLNQAKNKTYVQDKILNQIRGMLRMYSRASTKHNKPFNYFIEKYNSGENIENTLSKVKTDYPEAMKIAPEKDERETVELIPLGIEEETLLKDFPKEVQKIIIFFAGYLALNEISIRIPEYLNPREKNTLLKNSQLKWTASKDTKNEFVQLIYGLHQAGFINNGQGEITKITEVLSEVFGLDLGKNWQSNHSASIHKANSDYQPQIFDKIKQAYIGYAVTQREHKKKK